MSDFITLTCPTCGAKLKVTDKINLLVCASCGNEHMIQRDGGAIYLTSMAEDVRQMRHGVDKTAAELAIVRLEKEIPLLQEQLRHSEQTLNEIAAAFYVEQKEIDRENQAAAKVIADKKGFKGWFIKGCLTVVGLIFFYLSYASFYNDYPGVGIVILLGVLTFLGLIWRASSRKTKKAQAVLANPKENPHRKENPYRKKWVSIGQEVQCNRDAIASKLRQIAHNRQIAES